MDLARPISPCGSMVPIPCVLSFFCLAPIFTGLQKASQWRVRDCDSHARSFEYSAVKTAASARLRLLQIVCALLRYTRPSAPRKQYHSRANFWPLCVVANLFFCLAYFFQLVAMTTSAATTRTQILPLNRTARRLESLLPLIAPTSQQYTGPPAQMHRSPCTCTCNYNYAHVTFC